MIIIELKNKGESKMKKSTIIMLSVVGIIAMIIAMIGIYAVSINNTEIELHNRYDAQFNVVETTLDKMRKDLMNQFKVTKKFADDFIKVAQTQSEGRKGGTLLKFSTESKALGMNPELYKKMMNTISGNLSEFKRSQDVLTDVWRVHKTFCQKFPNSLMVGSKIQPKPEMISSSMSKEVMKTKKLDDNLLGD